MGLASGYYYFWTDGRIDKRKKFHALDTKIGTTRFKGSIILGKRRKAETNSWLDCVQGKKGIKTKNYIQTLNKNDRKLYTNRKISGTLYVDAEGKNARRKR